MPDQNNNLIPDKADKVISVILMVAVAVLALMIEGKWCSAEVTVWFQRTVALIGVLSSIFAWGVVKRPGGGH